MKKRDELRDKGLLQTIVWLFNYVWQTQSWENNHFAGIFEKT
jgi:hypothetical protein